MRRLELGDFVTDDHMIKLEKHFENEFTLVLMISWVQIFIPFSVFNLQVLL